jgi:ABC-type Fe3+-hydroxamate transport system substrate-binding protein
VTLRGVVRAGAQFSGGTWHSAVRAMANFRSFQREQAKRRATRAASNGTRRVGGTKNPDVAAIVGIKPDLVIVNAEENRREDFDALTAAGLTVFVTYPRRVAEVPDLLRRLGQLLGEVTAGDRAAADLEGTIDAAARATIFERGVFCPIWKNPWMTFSDDTFADDLLRLNGARNIFADRSERYFEVALDEVAAALPETILLPDEPYIFQSKDLPSLEPLSDTPALRNDRVHLVDGKALFWYGTRTAAAVLYLQEILNA